MAVVTEQIELPQRSSKSVERAAVTGVFFVNGIAIGAWAVTIPLFQASMNLSPAALSVALLALAAGAVIAMPVAGWLLPKLGVGQATRFSGVVFAATLLPLAGAASLPVLVGAGALFGAANGAMDVAMNAQAVHVEKRWERAIMSSFHAAFSGGGLAGAGLGALLIGFGLGAPGVLLAASAVALATMAACWKCLGCGEAAEGGSGLALPNRAALPLCFIALLCMVCEGAVGDWSAVYLTTVAVASATGAATGFAGYSAAMLVGRATGDRIVRRFSRVAVVRGGGLLAASGLALVAFLPAPVPAAIGFAFVGFGLANVVPAVFSAAGRLFPSAATGIAMVSTLGYGGFLAGPPVVGSVATLTSLRVGLGMLAAAPLVFALLARAVSEDRG